MIICNLPVEKFIPERCSPAFEFKEENIQSWEDDKVSNSQLWSKIVFWLADGNRCAIDLHNMANATIKVAEEALYSKEIVEALDLLKDEKHRVQTFDQVFVLETIGQKVFCGGHRQHMLNTSARTGEI